MVDNEVLRLEEVNSRLGADFSLNDISLSLEKGQALGLTGRSLSGKSALLQVIMGRIPVSSGSIFVEGKRVQFKSAADAIKKGLILVSSQEDLFGTLTVSENIYFGTRLFEAGPLGSVPRRRIQKEAVRLFEEMGVSLPPDAPLSALSHSQVQLVRIARAIASDAKVILLDEPAARLSAAERSMAARAVSNLKKAGRTFLLTSRDLDFLLEVSDQVGLMEKGGLRLMPAEAVTKEQLMEEVYGITSKELYGESAPLGEAFFRLEGASVKGNEGVSLELKKGEILSVVGNADSGAAELFRALAGFEALKGKVFLENELLTYKKVYEPIRRGILISLGLEEQRRQEFFLDAAENAASPDSVNWNAIHQKYRMSEFNRGISMIFSSLATNRRGALGENTRDVVDRTLHRRGKVYLLVDPGAELDLSARSRLYNKLRNLTAQGAGVLLFTSDLEEAIGMGGRVLVLKDGKAAAMVSSAFTTPQDLKAFL